MRDEVIVVIATLNECVFEIEKLNSSVKNCGCLNW
jgi:hypothetical protein